VLQLSTMAVKLSPFAILRRLGLRRFIQLISHLPSFLKLFSRLVRDPRVSFSPKIVLLFTLAYLVAPVDLLPDFIIGLGQIDDLMILYLGCRLFLKLCPKEVVQEHVQAIAAGR